MFVPTVLKGLAEARSIWNVQVLGLYFIIKYISHVFTLFIDLKIENTTDPDIACLIKWCTLCLENLFLAKGLMTCSKCQHPRDSKQRGNYVDMTQLLHIDVDAPFVLCHFLAGFGFDSVFRKFYFFVINMSCKIEISYSETDC